MAKKSREDVLNHEKFHIFKAYGEAIGINQVPEVDGWKAHSEKMLEFDTKEQEAKRISEARKQKKLEEER